MDLMPNNQQGISDDSSRIAAELAKQPFSAEFAAGDGKDYLLHLTRLIDRTSDLYTIVPVVPVSGRPIQRRKLVRIRAAFPKVRIRQNFTDDSWAELLDVFQEQASGNFASFADLRRSELVERQPDDRNLGLFEPTASINRDEWQDRIEAAVRHTFALSLKHDGTPNYNELSTRTILFLPEFTFPPFDLKSERDQFLKKIQGTYVHAIRPSPEGVTLKSPIDLEQKRNFIFLGSYHDIDTGHNVGVCLPSGLTPLNLGRRNVFQRQTNDGVYFQRKRNASKKLGERLSTVESLEFPVFVTDIGRIAVLICSDVYDVSLFLGLVRYNLRCLPGCEIDYVLVPSFNRSRKLVESCRQLSFLMNCVVVYATSYELEEERADNGFSDHTHCFISGRSLTEFGRDGMSSCVDGIVKVNSGSIGVQTKEEVEQLVATGEFKSRSAQKFGYVDYILDPEKVALLRLLTRKRYTKAIKEGSRRSHLMELV